MILIINVKKITLIMLFENIQQCLLTTVWKHVAYTELLQLGRTSKEFLKVLKNKQTWITLLQRDFNVNWSIIKKVNCGYGCDKPDPKDYYELYYWLGMDGYDDEVGDEEQVYNIKPKSEQFVLNKWRDFSYQCWKRDQNYQAKYRKNDPHWKNCSDMSWDEYKEPGWRKDHQSTFLVYKGTHRYDFVGIIKELSYFDATIKVVDMVARKEHNEQFECNKTLVAYLCSEYFYDIIEGKHRSILDILHWIDMHYRGEGDAYYDHEISITYLPDQVIG